MKRNHALLAMTFLAASTINLTGCSTWNPYRPDIVQGNIVLPENIAKLKTGMSATQVQAILGTPVTGNIFHPERWDYLYYHNKRGEKTMPQHLSLWFENDALVRWESEPSNTNIRK